MTLFPGPKNTSPAAVAAVAVAAVAVAVVGGGAMNVPRPYVITRRGQRFKSSGRK